MAIVGALTRDEQLAERCVHNRQPAFLQTTKEGWTLAMAAYGEASFLAESPLPTLAHGAIADVNTLSGSYLASGTESIAEAHANATVALYDPSAGSLHLYRAQSGIPPLFYWRSDRGFAWATTIRDLLTLGAPREIDHLALAEYQLSGFIQAPRTMLKGIRKLPASHGLRWHSGELRIRSYWHPRWEPKEKRPVKQQARDVEDILVDSIRDATPPSNRLGILLSGGIDSVCIAAVASKRTDADLTGFTFEYSDYEGKFNESEVASSVAGHLGIRHEIIPIDSEYVADQLPRLVAQYEEPFSYGVHSARLDALLASGVEVALTGAVGAMWTLSGASSKATKMHHVLPGWVLNAGSAVTRRLPGWGRKLNTGMRLATMSDARRYFAHSLVSVLSDDQLETLWRRSKIIHEARNTMVDDLERATPPVAMYDRFAAMGLMAFGAEHLAWWSHRWAEAASVSLRFPYMERRYIDYMGGVANRLPDSPERRLIAAKYLPQEIANSPKTPQTLPLDIWLAGPLYEFARETLSKEAVTGDGTFDFEVLERRLEEHKAGHANHKWSIWTVLCYLIWKREFLDSVPATR